MFRRLLLGGSALAIALLMSASAEAQFRGLRFPPSLENVFLLRGDAVQAELGLSDEQKTQLGELSMKLQQEALEIFSGLQDLTPEEQKEQMPEVMKMIDAKGKEVSASVDKILDKKQAGRLKELSFQRRGARALEDEDVVATLKLTDDQKKKLAELREESGKALEEAIQSARSGGGDQGQIREKIQKAQKEIGDKALAVLTPDQKKQFESMKGAEFKFPAGRGGFPF